MSHRVRQAILICVCLLASTYHSALCSLLNYENDAVDIERTANEFRGKIMKRSVSESGENEVPETTDGLTKLNAYDYDEMPKVYQKSDENMNFATNMKPIETTTDSRITKQVFLIPSPTAWSSVKTTTNVEDCCQLLRIGSYEEFESCLGNRCLAPNTCDGPEILEHCFFDGKYYPVNGTVHLDSRKCYTVKCMKNNPRHPPSTKVEDFGTGCCTRGKRIYRDGTEAGIEKCQEGIWTAVTSTTPAASLSSASIVSLEAALSSTVSEGSTTHFVAETNPESSTDLFSEASSKTKTSQHTKPTIPGLGQQSTTESTVSWEVIESVRNKTKTSLEAEMTSAMTKQQTTGEVASTPSSESSVEPGEEGTISVIKPTKPSSEVTERSTETSSVQLPSELTTKDIRTMESTKLKQSKTETTAHRSTVSTVTAHEVKATEMLEVTHEEKSITQAPEKQSTIDVTVSVEGLTEKVVINASTAAERVTTYIESSVAPNITGTALTVSPETTEVLASVSQETTVTVSPETQLTKEDSTSEAVITTKEVSASPESTVLLVITDTATPISVESTEGATAISPTSAVAVGPEKHSTKKVGSTEATTASEEAVTEVRTFSKTVTTSAVSEVSVRNTEGTSSTSPERVFTQSPVTRTTEQVMADRDTTTGEATVSSAPATLLHVTERTSNVSVEINEGLPSTSSESVATTSPETMTTKEIATFETATMTEELTTSESAAPSNATYRTTMVSVESTAALSSASQQPATTTSPETTTAEQLAVSEAGTTTEETSQSHTTGTVKAISIESTEGLPSPSSESVATISPEITTVKEIATFETATETEELTTSESAVPSNVTYHTTTVTVESAATLSIASQQAATTTSPETTAKQIAFPGASTTSKKTTPSHITGTVKTISMESTEGLPSTSSWSVTTISPKTKTAKEITTFETATGTEGLKISEPAVPSSVTYQTKTVSVESTAALLSASQQPATTASPKTTAQQQVAASGAGTTSEETTLSHTTGTVKTISVESTEGLPSTSSESVATTSIKTTTAREITTLETAIETEGLTISESAVPSNITYQTTTVSVESTATLSSASQQPTTTTSPKTTTVKQVAVSGAGTPSEETTPSHTTGTVKTISMETTEGLPSTSSESVATIGNTITTVKEMSSFETATETEELATSESAVPSKITYQTTTASVESTATLSRASHQAVTTTSPKTTTAKQVAVSGAGTTTEETTPSHTTGTVKTISVESTEGLPSTSSESVATIGNTITTTVKEMATFETATETEELTTSESAVPSNITYQTITVPVESTAASSSASHQPVTTTSPKTTTAKQFAVSGAGTTPEETTPSHTTGTVKAISVESTEGLPSTSSKSVATIGNTITTTVKEIATFETATETEELATSESAVPSNIAYQTTTVSVESTAALSSASHQPVTTPRPETTTAKQLAVSEAGTTAEETTPSHTTNTVKTISVESTEGLRSASSESVATISPEITTVKEIATFETSTMTGELTTSESAVPSNVTYQTSTVSVESTATSSSASHQPVTTPSPETTTAEQLAVSEAGTTTEETTPSHATGTLKTLLIESTEGLSSISVESASTRIPETEISEEITYFEANTTTERGTTSSQAAVSLHVTNQSTEISVESTEALSWVSPESAVRRSTEIRSTTTESTLESGITTKQVITPSESAEPSTVNESVAASAAASEAASAAMAASSTAAASANIVGLTSMSTETAMTMAPETEPTTKFATSELGTAGQELTTPSGLIRSPIPAGSTTHLFRKTTERLTTISPELNITLSLEKGTAKKATTFVAGITTKEVAATHEFEITSKFTEHQKSTMQLTEEDNITTEIPIPSPIFSSMLTSTTEETTTPSPEEYTCRWDNMTVSSSQTILRDPARCLHVECWYTVHGVFIDVTIVHEARGCCELQGKQMVPPGYVQTTRRGKKKRCVFGRWLTQYFDAAINMTSSKELPFKNKTYHFFPRLTPIDEALEICEKINGTLAVPDNRVQEMELGNLGAEAFGGQATFYINQDKIQQHVMNGQDEANPEKYIVYPHDSSKKMQINVNKPGTAYAVESFVENIQRMSVPICEKGGKEESFPEYFNNLVSIGTLTDQGLPKEAAYGGMQYRKDSKTLARLHEWRLPPVPRKFRDGHSNIGKELRRWGQVHQDLAFAIKNKKIFKDPLPVYKANHFNVM